MNIGKRIGGREGKRKKRRVWEEEEKSMGGEGKERIEEKNRRV